jgi:hypothetical protein
LYDESPDIFPARANPDLENNIPTTAPGQDGGNDNPNGGNEGNNHIAALLESVAELLRHAGG